MVAVVKVLYFFARLPASVIYLSPIMYNMIMLKGEMIMLKGKKIMSKGNMIMLKAIK